MSTTDQREEAKHDLVLADLEKRLEEVRQLKAYEPWKLFAAILTAVAIAAGVFGGGVGWTLAHWP
jgi:hypothetical protein